MPHVPTDRTTSRDLVWILNILLGFVSRLGQHARQKHLHCLVPTIDFHHLKEDHVISLYNVQGEETSKSQKDPKDLLQLPMCIVQYDIHAWTSSTYMKGIRKLSHARVWLLAFDLSCPLREEHGKYVCKFGQETHQKGPKGHNNHNTSRIWLMCCASVFDPIKLYYQTNEHCREKIALQWLCARV